MLSASHAGQLPIQQMVALLSARPARLFGLYPQKGALLPGSDADIVLYDPACSSVIDISTWQSRSRGSARLFDGMAYRGEVQRTIVRGRTVYANGQVIGPQGWGQMVRPTP